MIDRNQIGVMLGSGSQEENMKNLYIASLICFSLIGCATHATIIDEDIDSGAAGAAGSDFDGGAGAGGSGGSSGAGGASGSAGASAGGSAGISGSGGSGGGACIPKTCLTIAVDLAGGQVDPVPDACGLVDDGCGNMIDCGGCENAEQGCGVGDAILINDTDVSIVRKNNLCQGGCVDITGSYLSDHTCAGPTLICNAVMPSTTECFGLGDVYCC